MKTVYALLLTLLCWMGIYAQETEHEYAPLLREGVKWVYHEHRYDLDSSFASVAEDRLFTITIEGDTTIGGMTYKKVYRRSDTNWQNQYAAAFCSDTVPVAFLREEGRVVYAIRLFGNSYDFTPFFSSEFLKLQYGLATEDVVFYDFRRDGTCQFIGTTQVAGHIRDVFSYKDQRCVEGIGLDSGFSGDFLLYSYMQLGYPDISVGLHHVEDDNGNIIYRGAAYEWFDYLVGDANQDGDVDIEDLNIAVNIILGHSHYNAFIDITGDGSVDIDDVNAVVNRILKNK